MFKHLCVNWSEEADNGNMPDREDDLFQANKGTHAILVLMVMMMMMMMLVIVMLMLMMIVRKKIMVLVMFVKKTMVKLCSQW